MSFSLSAMALSSNLIMRAMAQVQPGQCVLILGASAGIGAYAVQIARAFGARVTAVAGPVHGPFLTALGADRVLEYQRGRIEAERGHDVLLGCIGATDWRHIRASLKPDGVFSPLNFKGKDLSHLVRKSCLEGRVWFGRFLATAQRIWPC
ncbi:NADPH:quinone reductase-like Zn-dependent oxidoreductase [Sagittula marina]|uniref:NADPH:quinone reductase-like Zn-dependent oxidoreductase n=1 Tax=Sagittula marina TaxID=943940 RepID=A0A7W6DTX8_9RHOB|nr:zinc-binding dehydrogenase [Sagittula marina]MBB3987701.1 NADPH:quinone reductase-like Zn-dependent oxidoreductase [Sagittula marina]